MNTYSDELYHHGIKGQKCGVRRYQNEDGSLTSAGIKRYAKEQYKQDSKAQNKTLRSKAYSAITNGNKLYADTMYNISSKNANKKAAQQYLDSQSKSNKSSKTSKTSNTSNKVNKKKYDYTNSDTYKNASRGGKQLMSTRYNNNKRKFGKRMANRIEYDIENGKSPTAATAKAMALESVQSVVLAIGTQAVLSVGPSVIKSGKNLVNSALNNMYNTSVETPDGKTIARYNQKYNF